MPDAEEGRLDPLAGCVVRRTEQGVARDGFESGNDGLEMCGRRTGIKHLIRVGFEEGADSGGTGFELFGLLCVLGGRRSRVCRDSFVPCWRCSSRSLVLEEHSEGDR